MDNSIERRHVVYVQHVRKHFEPTGSMLLSCPAGQEPVHARVVYSGSQQQCEHYMRDMSRLAQMVNGQ